MYHSHCLTSHEIQLILSKTISSDIAECHIVNFNDTNEKSKFATMLKKIIKDASRFQIVFLFDGDNSDATMAACLYLSVFPSCTLINFSYHSSRLQLFKRVLSELYPLISWQVYNSNQFQIANEVNYQAKTPWISNKLVAFMELIRQQVIHDQVSLEIFCFVELKMQQKKALSEALSEMFPKPFFAKTLCHVAKVSATIWLARIALTVPMFINLLIYSRESEDNLSSSVIILTLQRLILALSGSTSYITQINFSKGLEKQPKLAGKSWQAGWFMGLLLGGISAIIANYAIEPMLTLAGQPALIATTSAKTFSSLSWGFLGYAFFMTNGRILSSLDQQWLFMISHIFAAFMSVFAVCGFSYGAFGLPHLGATRGYGWGFTVQAWFACIPTTLYLLCSHHRKELQLFSHHSELLSEIFSGLKYTVATFIQKNCDIFAVFGLALYSGLLGTDALIVESVVESYRSYFGRVGGSSIANAVLALMIKNRKHLDLVATNKLHLPQSGIKVAVKNMENIGNAGYLVATSYAVIGLILYMAIPRSLSSLFLNRQYLDNHELMKKINITLAISGVSQLLDNIRQVQIGSQNAHNRFKSTSYIPIICNFACMLTLAYIVAFQLNGGVVGLEISNASCFLLTVFLFKLLISHYDNRYVKTILINQNLTDNDNSQFRKTHARYSSIWAIPEAENLIEGTELWNQSNSTDHDSLSCSLNP